MKNNDKNILIRIQIIRDALDGLSFFSSQDHVPRSLYESIKPLVETKSNYLFQPMESFLRITDQDTIGRSRSIVRFSFSPSFPLPYFFSLRVLSLRATTNDFVPEAKLDYSLLGWFLEVSVPRDSLRDDFEF